VLADVHRTTGVTVLHVTHDSRESRRLADVRLVLAGGAVTVQDEPLALGAVS